MVTRVVTLAPSSCVLDALFAVGWVGRGQNSTGLALTATRSMSWRVFLDRYARRKEDFVLVFSTHAPHPGPRPATGRGREIFVTFTQGGASLTLGYFLTPLTGLCKEEGPFILTPGS
jgi:hypothetical protein